MKLSQVIGIGNLTVDDKEIPTTHRLLTIIEIADLLSVSVKTVYWWVNRAEIPFLKIGKHLRFDASKVLEFFEEKTLEQCPQQTCLVSKLPLKSPDYWSLKTRREPTLGPKKGTSNGDH